LPLAIETYETLKVLRDSRETLNLAWTSDEAELLACDLEQLITTELRRGLAAIQTYHVHDPYGEKLLSPAVCRAFGTASTGICIVSGAGVNSLLCALARLAVGQSVYVLGDTYPDFPAWVERSGGRCVPCSSSSEPEGQLAGSILFLERPSLTGAGLEDLSELSALCSRLQRRGALVLIDESNANYYEPAYSAANLVGSCANLLVLRGLSKAYGMGGLRIGYCLSSAALRERLHAVIPPLLASSLSLVLAARILELGDVAQELRARIVERKRRVLDVLGAAGAGPWVASSRFLPYVLLRAEPRFIRQRIEDKGIMGKFHPVWPGPGSSEQRLYRMSVPLRPSRMDRFEALMACAPSRGMHA
jgi:histidinol-phosphate aminotransferase